MPIGEGKFSIEFSSIEFLHDSITNFSFLEKLLTLSFAGFGIPEIRTSNTPFLKTFLCDLANSAEHFSFKAMLNIHSAHLPLNINGMARV